MSSSSDDDVEARRLISLRRFANELEGAEEEEEAEQLHRNDDEKDGGSPSGLEP